MNGKTQRGRFGLGFLAMSVLAFPLFVACSSDPEPAPAATADAAPPPTNKVCTPSIGSPAAWQNCPTGETCWYTSANFSSFACGWAGRGVEGSECTSSLSSPTCGEDMICLKLNSENARGVCYLYCDPNGTDTCPEGKSCQVLKFQNNDIPIPLCQPGTKQPKDAGPG